VPAPDWLLAKPFAHRGLFTDTRPENSLAAIDAAIHAGFPVEIDVQVTRDGRAVVFHDWNLKRLTGRDAKVKDVTAAELGKLTLLGTDQRIPTLEETLDVIAGRAAALIEIKNRRYPTALEPATGRILAGYRGPFAIQSFNPYTLGWFRLRYPRFARGQISCAFDTDDMAGWKKKILENYGMNWMTAPHFISHQWNRLPAKVPTLLRSVFKLPLLTWTVRSEEEMAAALKVGDNVIFEKFIPKTVPRPASP
jgi:glycerophosphoryl diester phosphodiesterase